MKKYLILFFLVALTVVLSNCGSSRKAAATVPKLNYDTNLQATILSNCSPCHIPAKGGNKKPYDNYTNVKTDIDEIVRRIVMNPGVKGFMPFRKTTRLSDSTIAIFKQWRTDGLLEK